MRNNLISLSGIPYMYWIGAQRIYQFPVVPCIYWLLTGWPNWPSWTSFSLWSLQKRLFANIASNVLLMKLENLVLSWWFVDGLLMIEHLNRVATSSPFSVDKCKCSFPVCGFSSVCVVYYTCTYIYNLYSVKCFQHAILKELCYKMYLLLSIHFNTE